MLPSQHGLAPTLCTTGLKVIDEEASSVDHPLSKDATIEMATCSHSCDDIIGVVYQRNYLNRKNAVTTNEQECILVGCSKCYCWPLDMNSHRQGYTVCTGVWNEKGN